MTNSIDVIRPFTNALKEKSLSNVQIIGGINTVALTHPETIIDFDAKEVIAPKSLNLPTIRDDKARSLRDLDVFVKSSDREEVERIERLIDVTVGPELEQSVFGIVRGEKLRKQITHPLGLATFLAVVSDRYDQPPGVNLPNGMVSSDGMVKALFPFAVPLDSEALETWTLTAGDMQAPIPNPAMSIINYTTRSISGVRPKDAKKVETMASSVIRKSPELRDWAVDGPGAKQVELGLLLRSFTPNRPHADYFSTGRHVVPVSELTDSEMFMMPNLSHKEKKLIIGVTALKAQAMSFFESNPTIVTLWQKYVEQNPLIDRIVKNK